MSGVISSVKRFLGLGQNSNPLSRKRPLDRDSDDDDVIEVSSGKKQKLEIPHVEDDSPCSPKKIVDIFTSPLKSLASMGSNMTTYINFRGSQSELTFQQTPEVVDLTEDAAPKQRHRNKNALNVEIKAGSSLGPPVTIQASEPTRLENDHNEVHLLKVVNPNTASAVPEKDAVDYDSPLKTFEGFSSEKKKFSVSKEKSSKEQQQQVPRRMVVTKEELEKRNKNSSPGAMTKALKTGYKSVHDKFFYSQANAHNRKTLGDRFKFKKGKRNTAVKEAYKLEEKIKYLNILNNLNCSNNRNNASFISYASPGFSALKTPRLLCSHSRILFKIVRLNQSPECFSVSDNGFNIILEIMC